MALYDENSLVLKETNPDLYKKLENYRIEQTGKEGVQVLVGDALDGEPFLVYQQGDALTALNSTYSPVHEAERYILQYEPILENSSFLFFGFGDGQVISKILDAAENMLFCIIYEPSLQIFMKAMEVFDLRGILNHGQVRLIVGDLDINSLEFELGERVTYQTWKRFRLCVLSKYDALFSEDCMKIRTAYKRIIVSKDADLSTLARFAETGMKNEIHAMKWMMDCVSYEAVGEKLNKEVPYIVVAAGPSLEKNVEVLKQAKGKSVIICVDTAIGYLLKHGIIPDMICTVDPNKELTLFDNPQIERVPFVVSTDTNYQVLEKAGAGRPIYLSISNDFLQQEFLKQGVRIDYFDGGGSVATVCFQLGVEWGFKRIVLVGQDLAFTDKKAHAGMGAYKDEDIGGNFSVVDGYNDDKVITRGDFKLYLDWYNLRISQLEGCEVINATEGGAKINGAVQMPLAKVVDLYCTQECEVSSALQEVRSIWATQEERLSLYQDMEKQYNYFKGLQRRLKECISNAERGILLLERGNYQKKDLQRIDKCLAEMTREVEERVGIVILVKRMIDTEASLTDDLHEAENDLELESIRLYKKMIKYFSDMLAADVELLPVWKDVMEEIKAEYQLE